MKLESSKSERPSVSAWLQDPSCGGSALRFAGNSVWIISLALCLKNGWKLQVWVLRTVKWLLIYVDLDKGILISSTEWRDDDLELSYRSVLGMIAMCRDVSGIEWLMVFLNDWNVDVYCVVEWTNEWYICCLWMMMYACSCMWSDWGGMIAGGNVSRRE